MATTAKRKDKTAAKKVTEKVVRQRRLGPTDPIPELFGGHSREWVNDHTDLCERMFGSPGFALLLDILDDADALREKLHDLLRSHGPGSGSPLSRYVTRFKGSYLWDELRALMTNLMHGTMTARSDMPGVP